jgi:hypothetical protein
LASFLVAAFDQFAVMALWAVHAALRLRKIPRWLKQPVFNPDGRFSNIGIWDLVVRRVSAQSQDLATDGACGIWDRDGFLKPTFERKVIGTF